ncbi:MAG: prolipoprotein diacylglyceryl transferase [Candidatus Chisholmbacteria bacterium]|nr:prolipoprotein diacylglyceryl transferase [Candidatus Chisholmbacteria bacterium]
MLPLLFSWGPVKIYSFGVMAVVAFLAGTFLAWRQGREAHFDEEKVFDTVLVVTFWGLVGARLWYGLWHINDWGLNWGAWLSLSGRPGLSLFGGMLGGVGALWWVARRWKWDFFEIADVMMPGLVLALALGLVGAFLNGTGYGVQTNWPGAVSFPGVEGKRHPLQVYGAVVMGAWWWMMMKFDREYRTYDWYRGERATALPGFVFLSGMMGISLWLLGMSFWRPADWWWILSLEGWQWLGVLMVSGVVWYSRSGRGMRQDIGQIGSGVVRLVGRLTLRRRGGLKRSGGIKRGSDVVGRRTGL